MLSWVVKVVPQPPEPPKKDEEPEKPAAAPPPPAPAPAPPAPEKKVSFHDASTKEAPKVEKPKQEAVAAEGSGSQPSVLTWFSGALPQPSSGTTTKEENTAPSNPGNDKGMIRWIAQGLEKVVPQPDQKTKDQLAAEQQPEEPPEEPVEVCPPPPPPPAPEPPVTQVEVEPDREDTSESKPLPRMMDWLKQGIEKVVPQPETNAHSQDEARPANAETDDAAQQPKMMGWIVNELGRMLPQPVPKQDSNGDDVQSRGK